MATEVPAGMDEFGNMVYTELDEHGIIDRIIQEVKEVKGQVCIGFTSPAGDIVRESYKCFHVDKKVLIDFLEAAKGKAKRRKEWSEFEKAKHKKLRENMEKDAFGKHIKPYNFT
jgi:hypothetical protein